MRRFFILIVVLVLLALAVDRGAVWFAQRTIADQIQSRENLPARPDVSIGGFPFLTQVLRGKFTQIEAVIQDPGVGGGLKIDSLNIRLRGVRVSISDALNGRVDSVPVDAATADGFVSFAALNAAAAENLSKSSSKVEFSQGGSGGLGITGSYRGSGINVQLDLDANMVAKDGDLVVDLPPAALDGLPAVLRAPVKSLVSQAARLPSLPFGFQAESVTVGPAGISVQAKSATLELRR